MAVTAAVVKATATLLKSKKGRNIIKLVLGLVVGVFVLIAGVFFTIMNALTNGSNALAGWVFGDAASVPPEYAQVVQDTRASLDRLDAAVAEVNGRLGESKVDAQWVKAVFYVLCSGQPQPPDDFFPTFAACFVAVGTDGMEEPQTDDTALMAAFTGMGIDAIDGATLQQARHLYNQIPTSG